MKKRRINKIFYVLLLVLSFAFTNVYAITITTGTGNIVTNTASLTITGVESTDSFAAYKVVDAFYNVTTNEVTYDFTSTFKTFKNASSTYSSLTIDSYMNLTGGSITDGSTSTTSQLSALMAQYAGYIKSNSVTGTAMTVSGNTASATLPAGGYLVLPTSTTKVYAVMVGNLDFEASGSTWNLNNEAIVAKVDEVSLISYVGASGQTSGSFREGVDFTNYAVVDLPVYPSDATNKTFNMSISYDTSKVSVTTACSAFTVKANGTNLVNNTHYTCSASGGTINYTFNMNNITGTNLNITYPAKLTSNATLGNTGNTISYSATYAVNPYATGTGTTRQITSSTKAMTWGVDVLKYAGTDQTAVLPNAVFYLCTSGSCTSTTDSSYIGTITTDSTGYGAYAGIETGTFYLVEHTAPTGYRLLTSPIQVIVGSGGTLDTRSGFTSYYISKISNTAQGVLPITGGQGTVLYTIVGLSVVVIGSVFIVYYRKKETQLES